MLLQLRHAARNGRAVPPLVALAAKAICLLRLGVQDALKASKWKVGSKPEIAAQDSAQVETSRQGIKTSFPVAQ